MSSVARGLILPIVDWTRAQGHPCEGLFDGLSIDEPSLRGVVRRVSWADYIRLHERLAELLGGVERLGQFLASLPTPTVDWLLRSLDTPAKVYEAWSHLAPMLWSDLRLQLVSATPDALRITVEVPSDAPDATVWFRSGTPFLSRLPERIGAGAAAFEVLQEGSHTTEWLVRLPREEVPARPTPTVALDMVADVGEDYGAAVRELQEVRRQLAEPRGDFGLRVAQASERWELTRAQTAVLRGVVRGLSNKEIAAELGNAEATVEVHVTRVLRKAGAPGRTALVTRFWGGPA